MIVGHTDGTCAGGSVIPEAHWRIMLSDSYDKKCKVLMSLGHCSSAVHFGRLSAALDAGKLTNILFLMPNGAA